MKIIIWLFLFLLVAGHTHSQTIVQPESVPEIGDVLFYTPFAGFSDTISYRADGENVHWSFSGFDIGNPVSESYSDIAGTAIGDSFPAANMIVNLALFESAAIRTDSAIRIIGLLPGDFSGFGVETEPVFTDPFTIRSTPFQYGDSIQDEFAFTIQFPSELIPALDSIMIPFATLDSIRIRVNLFKSEKATAWGKLDIAGLSLDALKVQQEDITTVTIEAGVSTIVGFVWLDATEFLGDIAGALNQNSTTYKFLSAESKRSLIEFRETRLTDTTLTVTGRISTEIISGTNNSFNLNSELTFFPNPGHDYIQLIKNSDLVFPLQITIMSTDGDIVLIDELRSETQQIDVTSLSTGHYSLVARNQDGMGTTPVLIIRQ